MKFGHKQPKSVVNHMDTEKNVLDVHVFVCTNEREKPKTGCADLGAFDLVHALKKEMKNRKLDKKIRINKSGCLDQCERGPVIVIYPKAKWFFNVSEKDIPKIIEEIEE